MKISNVIKNIRSFVKAAILQPQTERRAMMVWGQPGAGKSSVIRQICREEGWSFHEIRLSDLDPTDLTGLPFAVDGRAAFLRPTLLPEDDGNVHVFLVDEVSSAPPAMAAIFSRMALTQHCGTHALPARSVVIGAGNRQTDRSGARAMEKHNGNRLDHLTLDVDADEVADWGARNNWPASVIGFLRRFPEVMRFDPTSPDVAWCSPRSMHALACFVRDEDGAELGDSRLERMEGIVGKSCAAQYAALESIIADIPAPAQVWADPDNCPVPDNVGARYVMSAALAQNADRSRMAALCTYAKRLGADLELLTIKSATNRDPALKQTQAYIKWSVQAQALAF